MVWLNDENAIHEVYLQWLYSKIGLNEPQYNHFWRIIRRLDKREFYIIVQKDENRFYDGMNLREQFADNYDYPVNTVMDILDGPCTVLEMLVAFASRIENEIMWNPDKGDRTAYWFWTMIWNLGLSPKKFSDGYFNQDCILELDEAIDKAVSRRYKTNGEGGFFPLKNDHQKNLRRVELWYQMQYWIEENYPIT